MDINELRGLYSLLIMAVFLGIVWWAFSNYRKKANEEAANLPFAEDDDEAAKRTLEQEKTEKKQ